MQSVDWEDSKKTLSKSRAFQGSATIIGSSVEGFAKIATPLSNLTRNKIPSNGRKNKKNAFNTLKEKLTNAPILKCADPSLPYEITSDASDTGVGAVLSQKDDKGNRPIAYTPGNYHQRNKIIALLKRATWNNTCPTNMEVLPSWG